MSQLIIYHKYTIAKTNFTVLIVTVILPNVNSICGLKEIELSGTLNINNPFIHVIIELELIVYIFI